MTCSYRLSTSPTASSGSTGAISVIELGGDVDTALTHLRIKPVAIERVGLREWPGVDTVVVARTSTTNAIMFPHGGHAVLRRAIDSLQGAGLTACIDAPPMERFPEARSLVEAHMLDALRRAHSPLAIDLLLDQPRRWEALAQGAAKELPEPDSAVLRRLIDPPTIVALGAPNIGKSSMLNALAGRAVSVVADIPGTTRDHVGVALDLAGLVVRFIDTPGIGALPGDGSLHDALDRDAQSIALSIAHGADLLLLCADAGASFLDLPDTPAPRIRIGLRDDLGPCLQPCDVRVSVQRGTGWESLTAAIRDALVPPRLLADERAWRFW